MTHNKNGPFDFAQAGTFGHWHRLMLGCRGAPEMIFGSTTLIIEKICDRFFAAVPFKAACRIIPSKFRDGISIKSRGTPAVNLRDGPLILLKGVQAHLQLINYRCSANRIAKVFLAKLPEGDNNALGIVSIKRKCVNG